MHNPTVGTFAEFIVEPINVLTMEAILPTPMEAMGAILLTPMEAMEAMGAILLTPMEAMEAMKALEDFIVRTNFGPYRRHMRRVYRPA
jgi:hypothetical protein